MGTETPYLSGVFRFVARLHTLSRRGMRMALAGQPKCRYGMLQSLYNLIEQHGCDGAIYVSDIARQMTRADYDKYDLLIGMDSANIRNMTRICGGDPAGKIHRLLDYTARPGDVADPWYTGDFSATWRDVAEGCRGLLKAITSQAM